MFRIAVSLCVFLLLVWLPVESALNAYCFNNYDLGIYAQALKLISFENINPYLSTRDVRIFNDHFDPVLLIFAPFAELVPPALLAIRVEMVCVFIASLAPFWLAKNGEISQRSAFIG